MANVYVKKDDGKSHHFVMGNDHYFDWAMFQFANCEKLPEGKSRFFELLFKTSLGVCFFRSVSGRL